MQYCSLQHPILLSSLDTSTAERCFHFGPAASFFLELLVVDLCSPPVACCTPSDLGDSSFHVISFLPFIQFTGFSWQVYWGGLPFPPPVHHVLSELSTLIRLSWVVLHIMACSFIELHKPFAMRRQVIHEGVSWALRVNNIFFFSVLNILPPPPDLKK